MYVCIYVYPGPANSLFKTKWMVQRSKEEGLEGKNMLAVSL